jgi:hemolysin activation/secretion protein
MMRNRLKVTIALGSLALGFAPAWAQPQPQQPGPQMERQQKQPQQQVPTQPLQQFPAQRQPPPPPPQQTTNNASVCVTSLQFDIDPGPQISPSAILTGLSPYPNVSFLATGIMIAGAKGRLNASQLEPYKPILDTLRVALVQKLRVRVYFDPQQTMLISISLLNQPC